MNRRKLTLLMGVVATFAMGETTAVFAQRSTEEIIVTARRRAESLQTVPLAVTAYTGLQLEQQGMQDVGDLDLSTPNLTIVPGTGGLPSGVNFSIRGQSGDADLLSTDSNTALLINDVYIPRQHTIAANFFDVESVQVLNGPQGTLFGKNTTGGAIAITTRRPDFDGYHGNLRIDVGNHGRLDYGGAANLPIIDDVLAFRLAFNRTKSDGYAEGSGRTVCASDIVGLVPPGSPARCRTANTGNFGDDDDWAFRGTMLLEPNNRIKIEVIGDLLKRRSGMIPLRLGAFYPAAIQAAASGTIPVADAAILSEMGVAFPFTFFPANWAALDAFAAANLADSDVNNLFVTDWLGPNEIRDDAFGVTGIINADLSENVHLESITAYRGFHDLRLTDLDSSIFAVLRTPNDTTAQNFSQEFLLSGDILKDRAHWQAGVFYNQENGTDATTSFQAPYLSARGQSFNAAEVTNTSWALYSQWVWDLTDKLRLTTGGRYTEETRELTSRNRTRYLADGELPDLVHSAADQARALLGVFRCNTPVNPGATFDRDPLTPGIQTTGPVETTDPEDCLHQVSGRWTGWSWLFSLDYQFTDDLMAYIKTSRGFRSGAHNQRGTTVGETFTPVNPEFARDIEGGVKWDGFDGRLRANVAGFVTKYIDKQETIIIVIPGVTQITTIQQNSSPLTGAPNRGRIYGAELDVVANPFEGFTLRGTGAYLNGTYVTFDALLNTVASCAPAAPPCLDDRSGEWFEELRPWTYSISGRYETPLFGDAVIVGGQALWSWRSRVNTNPRDEATALATLFPTLFEHFNKARGTLNLQADLEVVDWGTTVSVYARNALNDEYALRALSVEAFGFENIFPQEPRFWGVRLTKTFGAD